MSNGKGVRRRRHRLGDLLDCRACPRLVAWRESQASRVPPRHRDWVAQHGFWAKPVPAFGDADPWLMIVGLAPGAQGANRTGRMFTGDRSGEFLYGALYRAGLASQMRSDHRSDGLKLHRVLITAPVRCAPPGNRPTAVEIARCRRYIEADFAACKGLRVVLALGRIGHEAALEVLLGRPAPRVENERRPFRHGAEWRLGGNVWLVDSYHVSQQNTFTGRLTAAMFDRILMRCRALAEEVGGGGKGVGGRSRGNTAHAGDATITPYGQPPDMVPNEV